MSSFKEPDYTNLSFEQLAKDDAEFAGIYKANNSWVDFQNPQIMKQLTISLLGRDFGLKLQLPDDRLCPPIPVRYQYIQYITTLLTTSTPLSVTTPNPARIGIDIGTGASCIYPLLACAAHPSWRFRSTDIDLTNIFYARQNVEINRLKPKISVIDVSDEEKLLPWGRLFPEFEMKGKGTNGEAEGSGKGWEVDFVMCNPPFYNSKEEMMMTFSKDSPPNAVCTGAEVEMICPGGDLGFATRILDESVEIGRKVQWFTVMMGRLESVEGLVKRIREKGCGNWVVGTLVPGKKTRRWVVGWSWWDWRPDNNVARGDIQSKEFLPFPTELYIDFKPDTNLEDLGDAVNTIISALEDLKWEWNPSTLVGIAFIKRDVWSRSARRKKRKATEAGMDIDGHDTKRIPRGAENSNCSDERGGEYDGFQLIVRISCLALVHSRVVELRWLKGTETVLFESFCGMVKRKVLEAVEGKGKGAQAAKREK